MRVGLVYEVFDRVFQRRRALTQIQAVAIVVVVILAGVGAYFLGLIPGITSSPKLYTPVGTAHSTTPIPASSPPGTQKYESFMYQGYNRTYLLYISRLYDSNKPTPLVIFMHGGGGTPHQAALNFGFSALASEENFIVVYPAGLKQPPPIGVTAMMTAYETDNKLHIDDIGFVREIIYRLEQQYKVNPDMIYATGFSNGAFESYDLASELSNVFAAIAPCSGSIGQQDNASAPMMMTPVPSEPVSVIVFHGTMDDWVDYYGKPSMDGYVYPSVAKSVAFWVGADGCKKTPQNTTLNDGKVLISLYSGGKKGTEVVSYTMVGGVHAWPSGVDAAKIIWDFFMSHPKQH